MDPNWFTMPHPQLRQIYASFSVILQAVKHLDGCHVGKMVVNHVHQLFNSNILSDYHEIDHNEIAI